MKSILGLTAVCAVLCSTAYAEDLPPPQPTASPVTAPAPTAVQLAALPAPAQPAVALPAGQGKMAVGSVVSLALAETLNSKTVKKGDTFAIRLLQPIVSDAGVLVPAGVTGRGEVISAAPAGLMGKGGELLLAARYLDYNGARIPLRAFKLGGSGQDNSVAVMAVAITISPVLSLVVPGGNIEIPEGTQAHAKLAADIVLPVIAPAEPPIAPASASPPVAAAVTAPPIPTSTPVATATVPPAAAPASPPAS